ncbi:MAG: DUF4392 domain-containing protein [Proteobacteria bacterium]|nr:DUF4392 domain-containing protein [Pseudomonadota bacterium]
MNTPDLLTTSQKIESLLVTHNHRGMATAGASLEPGYLLRAARLIQASAGRVYILTGFPVGDTFETDGPAGAISLYRLCERLGSDPIILSDPAVTTALAAEFRCHTLTDTSTAGARQSATALFKQAPPALVISIERPGAAQDGRCYNMAGDTISAHSAYSEAYLELANCPTIAIGDGGNEIGMGNLMGALSHFDIHPAVSTCEELVVADVSNWAAYALCLITDWLNGARYCLADDVQADLEHLVSQGAVDGVTGHATATEDGFAEQSAQRLIHDIHTILAQDTVT